MGSLMISLLVAVGSESVSGVLPVGSIELFSAEFGATSCCLSIRDLSRGSSSVAVVCVVSLDQDLPNFR